MPRGTLIGCLKCIAPLLLFLGCQTYEKQQLSSLPAASNSVNYTGECPVWIFVPAPSLGPMDSRGFAAEIALPQRPHTTNRIEIAVEGRVRLPGKLQVPERCTVLEGISYAGGFTTTAYNRRLIVKTGSRTQRIHLRSRFKPGCDYKQVWYETDKPTPQLASKDDSEKPPADFILHDGDTISV